LADIFVSYSRQDKALVAPLVAALEAEGWSVWWDPEIATGQDFDRQIAAELKVAKAYDMLPENAGTSSQGRTPADNATVRSVFVIGPDKKVKAMLTYPMSTGRNFDEVLRLLDSCQLTSKHKVATPVNWKQGGDVIISPAVTEAEAKQTYPSGWKSPKPYIRIVPQPK